MQIFVKLPTGKLLTISVEPSDTVDDLKTKIQTSSGIASDRQRLAFAGKDLKNGTKLADARLTEESTVYLIISIFGNY